MNEWETQLKDMVEFAIYGAQMAACTFYTAVRQLYHKSPLCFVVTSHKENPHQIDGIPVVDWDVYVRVYHTDIIIAAVPQEYHNELEQQFKEAGINNFLMVDSSIENTIMKRYYLEVNPDRIWRGEEKQISIHDLEIYMAVNEADRQLEHSNSGQKKFLFPVQAGAFIASRQISNLCDNDGANISEKNRDYCELTVTYWAWKNRNSAYKGICHYRRHWLEDDLQALTEFDALVPYPNIYYPDAWQHHIRYIPEELWEIMLEMLDEEGGLRKQFEDFCHMKYLSNFNMVVAKSRIFNEYAQWLFSVLEKVENKCKSDKINTSVRYAGYLGEDLTAFYFMNLRKDIRTGYVGKRFLV